VHFVGLFFVFVIKNARSKKQKKNFFFVFENRAFYELIWKNAVQTVKPQVTMWRMRVACWIHNATNTNTHTHTHRICSVILTATMVTQMPLMRILPVPLFLYNCRIPGQPDLRLINSCITSQQDHGQSV